MPVRWTTCACSSSTAALDATALFRLTAPSDPPVTSTMGRAGSMPIASAPDWRTDARSDANCAASVLIAGRNGSPTRSIRHPDPGLRPVFSYAVPMNAA